MNFVTVLCLGFLLGLILKLVKKRFRFIVSVVVVFVLVTYFLQTL